MHRVIALFLALMASVSFASPVVLTGIHGEKTPFASLQGQWVFINYWASWCQPCVDEIAELNKFYQSRKDKVALYAVNFDALPISRQIRLMNDLHISYPALAKDPGPALGLEYPRGVPVTYVFDPKGKLVDTLYGGQTQASLAQVIRDHQPD